MRITFTVKRVLEALLKTKLAIKSSTFHIQTKCFLKFKKKAAKKFKSAQINIFKHIQGYLLLCVATVLLP